MPLPKRLIDPVYVSRDTLPEHLQLSNDLEGVTNGTLANIIRQLSSLSHHAEDLFGELYKETEALHNRSSNLQARIDRLAVKVNHLDSTVEEVSLQDIHLRKAFRSNVVFDQQVVSKHTIPTAMADTYHHCDKPPPLDMLNVYRYVPASRSWGPAGGLQGVTGIRTVRRCETVAGSQGNASCEQSYRSQLLAYLAKIVRSRPQRPLGVLRYLSTI